MTIEHCCTNHKADQGAFWCMMQWSRSSLKLELRCVLSSPFTGEKKSSHHNNLCVFFGVLCSALITSCPFIASTTCFYWDHLQACSSFCWWAFTGETKSVSAYVPWAGAFRLEAKLCTQWKCISRSCCPGVARVSCLNTWVWNILSSLQ